MPAIWRNINRFGKATVMALATSALIAPVVNADTNGGGSLPNFMMTWDATGDQQGPLNYDPLIYGTASWGTFNLGGPAGARTRTGWRYEGGFSGTDNAWTLSWDCVVNPDPFVDATINVTNNSLLPQTFLVIMPLAIAPAIPDGTIMNGSVSAIVTDGNFDGTALLTASGLDPVYRAFIDNNQVASMWTGYALAAIGPGNSNSDSLSFTNQPGPPANNEIKIILQFNLSPGDSASLTGIFDIQPIPGPAGLSILAIFTAFGARRRRR